MAAKNTAATPQEKDQKQEKETPVKATPHSTKADVIKVEGKDYVRFALIAAEMGVAFQQVYQRSQKAKDGLASVKESGILYGSVEGIAEWKQEKIDRAARKVQRDEEKAKRAEASKQRKAAKLAAAQAKEETEAKEEAEASADAQS